MSVPTQKPALDQPVLFISDVHLGGFSEAENARIESELVQVINYCQRNNIHIAILGDLFDYWMEYPNHIPQLGTTLLKRFEEFNHDLGPTLYITGNHDNWTRDHFQQRGFYLEHEYHTFSIDNHNVMAMHGDGLSDASYNFKRPLLHRILRNEHFINIFQRIFPPRTGITIMKYFSRFTRRINEDGQKAEKLNQWVQNKLKESTIDILLCGHDHIPRQKQFSFGTYINLGTFYQHRTMALYNNDAISLVFWEPDIQSFTQFENSQSLDE